MAMINGKYGPLEEADYAYIARRGADTMATIRRTDSEILNGLWEITLDGFHDAECGSVDENGYWYGLIRFSTEADELGLTGMVGAIVETDSYGFKGYNAYETTAELDAAWADCEASAAGEDTEDSYYA